jgi:hypothetical protein
MRLSTALFTASGVAVLFSAAPFLSAGLATFIAQLAGCRIHEGGAEICLIAGIDAGPTLYAMFVAFWLFMFSWLYLPVALLLFALAAIFLVVGKRDASRNKRTGWIFWLLYFAAMVAPFEGKFAILLAFAALIMWWRKSRMKSP